MWDLAAQGIARTANRATRLRVAAQPRQLPPGDFADTLLALALGRQFQNDAGGEVAVSDDLDFLCDEAPTATAAVALEGVRAELLDWAAPALSARHPHLRRLRGTPHVAHARRDLDAHTRHLHNALVRGDAAELASYLTWAAQQPGHADLADDLELLGEAIQRFVPQPHAATCGATLRAAQAAAGVHRDAREIP